MKGKTLITILVMSTVVLFGVNAEIDIFPRFLTRIAMPDPGLAYTELKIPDYGFSRLEASVGGLLPNIYLGKTLPLLKIGIPGGVPETVPPEVLVESILRGPLPKNFLEFNLIGSILVDFPRGEEVHYEIRSELFINSPIIDATLNCGESRLYLVGGFSGEGSCKPNELNTDENFGNLFSELIQYYGIFTDLYIVANNYWSDQWLILRGGIENLGKELGLPVPEGGPNTYFSATFELPSILPRSWLKLAPCFSVYVEIPVNDAAYTLFAGQLGFLLKGRETDKGFFIYARAEYDTKSWKGLAGVKMEL